MKGPIGLLPLAPLCEGSEDIESVVASIDRRVRREIGPGEEGKFWLAVCTLMGLYYDQETVFRLLPKGKAMKESSTYQAILNEGRQEGRQEGRSEEALRLLLRLGENAIGKPQPRIRERLTKLQNVDAIESMIDKVNTASSWEELIAGVSKSRKRKT